jgi:hypothetical protein
MLIYAQKGKNFAQKEETMIVDIPLWLVYVGAAVGVTITAVTFARQSYLHPPNPYEICIQVVQGVSFTEMGIWICVVVTLIAYGQARLIWLVVIPPVFYLLAGIPQFIAERKRLGRDAQMADERMQ